MRQSCVPVVGAVCPERDPDWIEQQIIRAYVQLAVEPDDANGSCSVTLVRLGSLEVCLTEMPQDGLAGLPAFWLELRSQASGAVIDSLGCYEFDEDELAATSEFIRDAISRWQVLH